MASSADYRRHTGGHLGVGDDCPLCGAAWPSCRGACAAHDAGHGRPGPFHGEFNDDCPECHPEADHGDAER